MCFQFTAFKVGRLIFFYVTQLEVECKVEINIENVDYGEYCRTKEVICISGGRKTVKIIVFSKVSVI